VCLTKCPSTLDISTYPTAGTAATGTGVFTTTTGCSTNYRVDCTAAPTFLSVAWLSTNIPTLAATADCTSATVLYSYNTTAVFGKICMPFYAAASTGASSLKTFQKFLNVD